MLFMHINILVLAGVPGSNIQLELVAAESGQAQYFVLDGNQLRLSQPLDRDADDLSSLVLQVGGLRAVSLVPSWVKNSSPTKFEINCKYGEFVVFVCLYIT